MLKKTYYTNPFFYTLYFKNLFITLFHNLSGIYHSIRRIGSDRNKLCGLYSI